MRSKGTASELEARRRIAVEKLREGWTQAAIADFLDVHPVTVAKWMARHRQQGDAGLAAKPTPGRPRFLTPDQEHQILGWLPVINCFIQKQAVELLSKPSNPRWSSSVALADSLKIGA